MPDLDVNSVLASVYLSDDFVVERRSYANDSNGRVVLGEPQTFMTYGVVQAASPDGLDRNPDEQHMAKTISVITPFRLRGPSKDGDAVLYQPDEVLWHGNRFQVINVGDYSGYGEGFIIATASSVDSVDAPPPA